MVKKAPDIEIDLIRSLIDRVSSTYNLTQQEVVSRLSSPDAISAEIFCNEKLSPLEVLVKYLRETRFNKFSDIAKFLRRSPNTIQTTYNNAQKKQPKPISTSFSGVFVPLSVFSTNKFTVFEALVMHLREEKNMANRDIAKLLKRSGKTIWTVYNRAKEKKKR